MKLTITFLLLPLLFQNIEYYRILGIITLPGKSHMTMFESIMKGLAAKGHEVDVVSHFPLKKQIFRYNDISLRGTIPILENNLSTQLIKNRLDTAYNEVDFFVKESGSYTCKAVFTSTVGNKLKNTNKKYDLVVTHTGGSDCMLGFAHYFKIPAVTIITSVSLPWAGYKIGNPDNPSYITNIFLAYVNPLNILERLTNTVTLLMSKLVYKYAAKKENVNLRNFFGHHIPDLENIASNISLIVENSHFSMDIAHPNVPNYIDIAGSHIQLPKPLPKHLENSLLFTPLYKGVIYLSMGSMVISETIAPTKLQALFDAFSELPYKVLWKATRQNISKDMDIPLNIQFEQWLPQSDILCHPNIKLFVTHGGRFGTQESVYCGVPCLGIPLYLDQELNLRRLEAKGLAKVVKYDDITKENILNAAINLLEDPKYKKKAEVVSKYFKDQPISPLDAAIYWMEYVIKHKGTPGLRSDGADLPWYQFFLVDVVLTLITFLIITVALIFYISRYMLLSWYCFQN